MQVCFHSNSVLASLALLMSACFFPTCMVIISWLFLFLMTLWFYILFLSNLVHTHTPLRRQSDAVTSLLNILQHPLTAFGTKPQLTWYTAYASFCKHSHCPHCIPL